MDYYALQNISPSLTETVVVLAGTYWLIASVSSFIIEFVGAFFNMRGRALRYLLTELLQGALDGKKVGWRDRLGNWFNAAARPNTPVTGTIFQGVQQTAQQVQRFTQDFFGHELIKGLEQPTISLRGNNQFPSYVPSHTFVAALFDNILNPAQAVRQIADALDRSEMDDGLKTWLAVVKADFEREFNTASSPFAQSPNAYQALVTTLAKALSDVARRQELLVITKRLGLSGIIASQSAPADQVAAAIGVDIFGGPNGPLSRFPASIANRVALTVSNIRAALLTPGVPAALRDSLLPLADAAQFDIDDFTRRVQNWFDDSMARAGGWFKRRVQFFLLIIGALLVTMFNVDTITISQKLLTDATTREHLANVSGQLIRVGNNLPTAEAFVQTAALVCSTGPTPPNKDDCSVDAGQTRLLLPMLLRSPDFLPVIADFEDGLIAAKAAPAKTCTNKASDGAAATTGTGTPPNGGATTTAASTTSNSAAATTSTETASDGTTSNCPVPDAGPKPQLRRVLNALKKTCDTAAATGALGDACGQVTDSLTDLNKPAGAPSSAEGKLEKDADNPTVDELAVRELAARFFWDTSTALDIMTDQPASKIGADLDLARKSANDQVAKVDTFVAGLPEVGFWPYHPGRDIASANWCQAFLRMLRKLAGLLISACLVSIGAPFWFQLVQNLVNVRSTGPKPKAADAESYED